MYALAEPELLHAASACNVRLVTGTSKSSLSLLSLLRSDKYQTNIMFQVSKCCCTVSEMKLLSYDRHTLDLIHPKPAKAQIMPLVPT